MHCGYRRDGQFMTRVCCRYRASDSHKPSRPGVRGRGARSVRTAKDVPSVRGSFVTSSRPGHNVNNSYYTQLNLRHTLFLSDFNRDDFEDDTSFWKMLSQPGRVWFPWSVSWHARFCNLRMWRGRASEHLLACSLSELFCCPWTVSRLGLFMISANNWEMM